MFSPGFINCLLTYRWPGNIRELENVIKHAVVISNSPVLDESLLPEKALNQVNSVQNTPPPTVVPQLELQNGLLPPDLSFETAIQNFKRQLVRQALRECNGLRMKPPTDSKSAVKICIVSLINSTSKDNQGLATGLARGEDYPGGSEEKLWPGFTGLGMIYRGAVDWARPLAGRSPCARKLPAARRSRFAT